MSRSRSALRVAVLATALAGAGACGSDRFDRQRAINDLREEADLTTEQAVCVVDAVEQRFGRAILNERREPTAEERDVVDAIKERCVATDESRT